MVLPKSMRLRGYRSFDHLYSTSNRFYGSFMTLRVSKANPEILKSHKKQSHTQTCRCAVSISNKVSKRAVKRNKLRRIFHDYLRQRLIDKPRCCNNWLLVTLKPNCSNKDPALLIQQCDNLLFEAGLIK